MKSPFTHGMFDDMLMGSSDPAVADGDGRVIAICRSSVGARKLTQRLNLLDDVTAELTRALEAIDEYREHGILTGCDTVAERIRNLLKKVKSL